MYWNYRRCVCLCLAICVWSGNGTGGGSQAAEESTKIAVSLKGQKKTPGAQAEQKLGPELLALMQAGKSLKTAKLVGRSQQGKAVVQTDKRRADQLFMDREQFGIEVSSDTEDFIPIKRLLLSYEKGKRPTDASLKKAGLKVIEDYEPGTYLVVEPIDGDGITVETVNQLDEHKQVKRAFPSYKVKLSPPKPKAGPDAEEAEEPVRKRDPAKRIEERNLKSSYIPSSLNIANVPQPRVPSDDRFRDLWGMQTINAPQAWSSVTSSPVIVGVIDTGIDYNHPDLIKNVWTSDRGTHGYNALTRREDPMDDNGHGTHCAGTIAAMGDNGIGVAGVCWNVKVMGLKFLDERGHGDDDDAIRCIDFAIANGVRVLSNSWGGYDYTPELQEAIERAKIAGVLFIAAAGNDSSNNNGRDQHYPSSYPNDNIIAVMSIDPDGRPSYFTNYGFESVDIAAPGSNILSTWPGRRLKAISGTSMATPHVAGAAALLWGHSKFQSAHWKTIKDELLSAKNIQKGNGLEDLCVTGGILDLEFLAGESATPSPPDPTPVPAIGVLASTASAKFQDPKCVTGDDNLLHVQITLTESSEVWIRADTSVQCRADLNDVSTGFFNGQEPGKRWQGSARHASLTAGRWTQLHSSYVVTLEPGAHDLYWKFWDEEDSGQKLTFNAGAMTVIAVRATPK